MSSKYDRKDHLYNRAKEEGLRSRAVYKLEELDKKYGLLHRNSHVLDLGAWPGSWAEYIASKLGENGFVLGIDLVHIEEIANPRVKFIQANILEESIFHSISSLHPTQFDLVVSDLSPKLTGIRDADQAAVVNLAEGALMISKKCLKPGGHFLCKLFKGSDTDLFVKKTRPLFNKLKSIELDATRKSSNEFYLLGFGLK